MYIVKQILKYFLAVGFVLAGVNHFINPDFYLKMMPPYLPAHSFLIQLSGVFEIALGIMLLIPRTTRLAAFGLVALLIAVFPANLYMAQNPQLFPEFSPAALYLRLPVQLILLAWAFWYAKIDN